MTLPMLATLLKMELIEFHFVIIGKNRRKKTAVNMVVHNSG